MNVRHYLQEIEENCCCISVVLADLCKLAIPKVVNDGIRRVQIIDPS